MIKLERKGLAIVPDGGKRSRFAKFNPGVAVKDGIVRILYRYSECATERTDNSEFKYDYVEQYISYATATPDGKIIEDTNKKVIYKTRPEESEGCEDARVVEFEGSFYIFHTAYDGHMARVGVVKTDDFENYEKLGIVACPFFDKDAFIFPERINGKIAYIHRVEPSIQIDYFDSIDEMFDAKTWEGYEDRVKDSEIMGSLYDWENSKVGGSMPPIKTDEGWIFIFHSVDKNKVYRASAALLDLENPNKVIARLPYPILEPEEDYELYGDVDNVVFPEGGYIHNNTLYVYYGAADKRVGIATVDVDELLNELKKYKQ